MTTFPLSFTWNPSEGIDLGFYEIKYYSLMWVVAFAIGFYITKKIFNKEGRSADELDSLFIYSMVSIMVGARLGHVLFYQTELLWESPFEVFLPISKPTGVGIFEFSKYKFSGFRGLASHGAAIAMIIGMYYYSKKVIKKPLLWVLDRVVIPCAFGAIAIRLGNFFNSEMIGKPSGSEWGVIFAKIDNVVRHPGQLYEAFGYVFVFATLMFLYWKKEAGKKLGTLFGTFLVMLMGVRFIVEYFKIEQVDGREDWVLGLNTGQLLSIPFVLIGIYFIVKANKKVATT
ncbi:prolipoprotein diacylglyceryl transferase [Spongiivirga citrea]|uniref:Phosphatidylglycerol--prolipoprotein diacylglyceryl transferase n=1 Tax=Spongiivirga citrea TaxID=1481457 RepID=A0A6M0CLN6_9FLAO|nr:prolipoprotein diacylglyceryl transferase [Spongiivirga citrea]NER18582.1 prolipoprotein diacylglyceryl transferase [Spongiivirga citrea]